MTTDQAIPMSPDRQYDLPAGPRMGHAAALQVPRSEGPASTEPLDRESDPNLLMAEEPRVEPARQMEAGTEYDEETVLRLAPLFAPLNGVPPTF